MSKTADTTMSTLEHRIGPRGRFTLRQAAGEIAIRGVEGDTVRIRSLDGDRSLGDRFNIETGDDFVELRQIERFGLGIKMFGGGDSPELEVQVPHGATVSVESASAELEASDLSGSKHFRTASGDTKLRRLSGNVEIETVSGDIDLEGQAPIDLNGRSVSGDVRVRVPRIRRLEMGTTSGDIWLDADLSGDGPFALRSISGDVTIVGRGGFRVEAQSITGDLSSDLPSKRESGPGRKVLVVGRPGPTLTFKSVSGDFHVTQPRDSAIPMAPDAPEPPAPPAPPARDEPGSDLDAARMDILRGLERGEISVAEATDRLTSLDEAIR